MKKTTIFRTASVIGIISIGFLGMILLGSSEKHSNKNKIKPEVRTVEVQNLDYKDMELQVAGNGVIESQNTLNIVSEASGQIMFAKNNLKDGTFVKKGEKIVEIDSRQIKNDLYSLRSDFLNSVASILPELKFENENIYNKWKSYFNRIKVNENIPELPKITNSQEQIKVSTRNVFTKYYNVKNKEIFLAKHQIKAPFDGYIKASKVIKNSFVSINQNLFTIIDAKNLEIAVPLLVDEFSMIDFKRFPKVKICSENREEALFGKINRKDTKLDRNSQSLNVYVSFNNNQLNPYFLPGNYVHVKIQGKKVEDVAKLPRHVVDDKNFIYTMEDGKLNRHKVDLVAIQENTAIVKNTLPNNTQVVTTILQKPLIGMELQTLEQAKQAELEKKLKEEETNSEKLAAN